MRFAKIVFTAAGIWGILVLTPLYAMYDAIGGRYPPPISHPDFYYGFIAVGLAWQLAFLVIGRDPVRLRPRMIPAMVEKFAYMFAIAVLYAQGRMHVTQVAMVSPDLVWGVLFVAAFARVKAYSPAIAA
jgi:hypothetical protein